MTKVVGFDVISDTTEGIEGGFLAVRRLRLRNRRDDGSRSEPYICDFLVRPKGIDAVVVALFHRGGNGIRVLVREGLRPALTMGRPPGELPVADARPYLHFAEVVAGIIEADDRGQEGIRVRAALEVEEEAGYTISPDDVMFLGAGSFPSPGSMPEKFWLTAVEIPEIDAASPPPGDGSPMEEGATTRWMGLDDAIAAFGDGRLEDAKSELALRRLRDRLQK